MEKVWLTSSATGKLNLTDIYPRIDTSHKNISNLNGSPSTLLLMTAWAKYSGKKCKNRQSDLLHVLLPARGAGIRQVKPPPRSPTCLPLSPGSDRYQPLWWTTSADSDDRKVATLQLLVVLYFRDLKQLVTAQQGWGSKGHVGLQSITVLVNGVTLPWDCGVWLFSARACSHNFQLTSFHILVLQLLFEPFHAFGLHRYWWVPRLILPLMKKCMSETCCLKTSLFSQPETHQGI